MLCRTNILRVQGYEPYLTFPYYFRAYCLLLTVFCNATLTLKASRPDPHVMSYHIMSGKACLNVHDKISMEDDVVSNSSYWGTSRDLFIVGPDFDRYYVGSE